MVEPKNNVTPDNHFDMLLKFLKNQQGILERFEQLKIVDKVDKAERKQERRFASTRAMKKDDWDDDVEVCSICGDGGHANKIYFCKKFKSLKLSEKKTALKKLRACRKCLGHHDTDGYCRDNFLCRNPDCKRAGSAPDHHYFLCPTAEARRGEGGKGGKDGRGKFTEEQEAFLSQLTPELAEQCRKAFTNRASATLKSAGQSELQEETGLTELPVIMMLMLVTANAGQKIGTLIDLASDTNYITQCCRKTGPEK